MDYSFSKDNGEKKIHGANNNQCGKWERMEDSDTDENHSSQGASHKFPEWQSPNDYGDGNADIFNLQRLAMEHRKSPFPDFQFDMLDNEADTDDNGCESNLTTGTKKKSPARMDSWEDNWLFQQKKCSSRTTTNDRSTLTSMRMYGTIEEHKYHDNENCEKDDSDASECSDNCKSMEVQRVERPCVRTSSSSDAEDSEDSESMDTPSRKSNSNDDDKIPFLQNNQSTSGSSDSTDSSGKANQPHENIKDMASNKQHIIQEKMNNLSKTSLTMDSTKRTERQYPRKISKSHAVEDNDSDDSIKDEFDKKCEEKASCSYSANSVLPKLLVEHCHSPRPVSGTKSCTSEESSSDEFERKAAAYKSRRRASWCPLDTPVSAKKRGKRRTPLLPLRVDDDEPEVEIKPLSKDAEALVGLERQMLHRDAHHSSFRAKKASPNFVLNPLYMPEGDAVQNPGGPNLLDEPNPMQHLQPSKSESGYSSCSPDSMANQNNMLFPQQEMRIEMGARQEPLSPTQRRLQSNPRVKPVDPDSSFLW